MNSRLAVEFTDETMTEGEDAVLLLSHRHTCGPRHDITHEDCTTKHNTKLRDIHEA